jgi:hypothetical protein
LIVYPDAVPIPFPKVFARTDGGTPFTPLMTVQQSVLAVDDDGYRGSISVGSSSRRPIYNSQRCMSIHELSLCANLNKSRGGRALVAHTGILREGRLCLEKW